MDTWFVYLVGGFAYKTGHHDARGAKRGGSVYMASRERDDHRKWRNGEIPTKGESAMKLFVFSISQLFLRR